MNVTITARDAVALVCDDFTGLPDAARSPDPDGPIGWDGYDAALRRAEDHSGQTESVVCGAARIGGHDTILIVSEFGFCGGSLGERAADRIVAAHRAARERGLPVVTLLATGGTRIHEGMRALTQLGRIARHTAATRAAGLAQLTIVCGPTTGGGWVTLGAAADVTLALPGTQLGFAGSRVRPADADPVAYTAEDQFGHGQIDGLVDRARLRATLTDWLGLLTNPAPGPAPVPAAGRRLPPPATGAAAVRAAREPGRPRADTYVDRYFDHHAPIVGDRCGGVDPGMRCGFGSRDGRSIGYAAQCGTPTRPAGFRTAARLIRTADRLGIPVLTLIDTPGAANDDSAERAGVGAAIADLFSAVGTATVPVTSLVIGEGGSGGALALAAPDRTWITPDGYFSVIGPEAAAAIIGAGPGQVDEVADRLRLRPQDLVELGIVRGIAVPA